MTQQAQAVEIPRINLKHADLTLIGDSPLISHRWSEKAKKQMLNKQMKIAQTAKTAKNPEMDFYESLYWLNGMPAKPTMAAVKKAKFGFPAVAFKSAAVDASLHTDGGKKTISRAAFHIDGELVEIQGTPVMREDMVRVGMGSADLRYRGEFKEWSAKVRVTYNADVMSLEQIVNLFNLGGFGVGIGEWRPQKDGSNGRFHVGNKK